LRANDGEIQPQFVNQYLLTDLYCYEKSSPFLRRPVMPSITTLIDPCKSTVEVVFAVLRALFIIVLSHIPGRPTIKRTSVANTSVVYHDGRALATCESGPPLRFALPGLQTIGWFDGVSAENELRVTTSSGFGGSGLFSNMNEWTTGHPRVDFDTKELIAFHSTFVKPYIRYSIVKPESSKGGSTFNQEIPGISSPKLMHDFGVSSGHTVIMDLPLVLDPKMHLRQLPSLHYDMKSPSRFGVFPRYEPKAVRWFETKPCLIFHTANCWDSSYQLSKETPRHTVVNLLACRLTSAALIFSMGSSKMPEPTELGLNGVEDDHCRLSYYSFPLPNGSYEAPQIQYQWALSAIPFEFPTVSPLHAMKDCRYVYGCSSSDTFTAALGRASKIDYLVKADVHSLISRGVANPPQAVTGCVDSRSIIECATSQDEHDPINVFPMPKGWYAQEARFVPRRGAETEDDGWLLSYVFDESQLDDNGNCRPNAVSELWVIDAKGMREVVAKIRLPQRVPYGLHGDWFSEECIAGQRSFDHIRQVNIMASDSHSIFGGIRDSIERWLG
jgi:carotenoid cleavage dioxygenase-like enzyme